MRDIAFSLLMLGLLPYILVQPYFGLLIWSWLSYMNPHRLTWGFAYSFPWVQLVAIMTMVALLCTRDRRPVPMTPITWLIGSFLAWTAISTMFAFNGDAAWQDLTKFFKIQIMVIVTLILIYGRQRIHLLIWVIALSIAFYGVKGGIFTILTGGQSRVLGPANSFIADNNALALALCMVLPLMRYLQLQATWKLLRIGFTVGITLVILAIFATYSRGGLISLAAVGLFLVLKSRRKFTFIVVLALTVPLLLTFMPQAWVERMSTITHYENLGSVASRFNSWQFAFNVAADRPLVGGGFDVSVHTQTFWQYAPADADKPRAIHSIYFEVLGEQGFVGLALFLGLLFAGWRTGTWIRRRTRRHPDWKWAYDLASMLQVSVLAFMAGGAFLPLAYFDLIYQLLAVFVLLRLEVEKGLVRPQAAPAPVTVQEDHRGKRLPGYPAGTGRS